MRKYGLVTVSAFLVHSAGWAAYIFFVILRDGSINLGEPMRPILVAEFGMAVVWSLVGIIFFVVAARGLLKKKAASQTKE